MKRKVAGFLVEVWLPVALLVTWWITSASSVSPFFPPLRTISETFADTWFSAQFVADAVPSLLRFMAALLGATVLGIGLGTLLGLSGTLRLALQPILDFFRALPTTALLPIAILVLGVGDTMKVFVIAFGALWPILLNTIDGVRGVDSMLHDVAKVYGLTRSQWLFRVVLPSASPQIFVGARVSLAIGLVLMVVSEMVASTNGLGHFVLLSQQTFAIPQMWSGVILLGLIGYATNLLFVLIERRVLAWHAGSRASTLGERAQASRKSRPANEGTPDATTSTTA